MTGITKSDLLMSTASAPTTQRSFAVEAFKTRGVAQPEQAKPGLVSQLATAWRRANARRTTLRQLSHLEGRLLRDIGVEPSTLAEAVNAAVAQRVQAKPSLLSRLVTAWRRAQARRTTIQQLSHLEDRVLRDIGLEPGTLVETVDAAVYQREPSYHHDNHGALASVGRAVMQPFEAVRRAFAKLDDLQRLNDHLLADVGISRADLETEIVDQRVAAANHNRALFRAA